MSDELNLVSATIGDGTIELIYADGPDESAAKRLCVRWPIETDPQASLAFHYLQALHLVRNALAPEMQKMRHIVDQTDESIRFRAIAEKAQGS